MDDHGTGKNIAVDPVPEEFPGVPLHPPVVQVKYNPGPAFPDDPDEQQISQESFPYGHEGKIYPIRPLSSQSKFQGPGQPEETNDFAGMIPPKFRQAGAELQFEQGFPNTLVDEFTAEHLFVHRRNPVDRRWQLDEVK